MSENRIIELLVRRASRQISDSELVELEALLAAHPEVPYYETFIAELWKKPSRKTETKERFQQHLKRHADRLPFGHDAPPPLKKKRHTSLIWSLSAAAIVIVTLGSYLFFNDLSPNSASEDANPIEFVAVKGMKKQITLPDGTKAWLNSDSRLSYPANFGKGKNRDVYLVGEAYFDVVKNERKPFTITTDKITIKVLGTSFNVKAYPEERKTEATLISGEIELSVNNRPSKTIRMKPNEKVEVVSGALKDGKMVANNHDLVVSITNVSKIRMADKEYVQEASWKDDKLIFKEESLNDLLPKLERWYNVDIKLENQRLGEYKYTGSITKESLTQALGALQLIQFFNFKIEKDEVIIF